MPDKLFVYGTLHPDTAPPEIREDVSRLRLVGSGTVRGTLVDFGDYPGVLLKRSGSGEVHGHIFEIPSDPNLLDRLDQYEEYYPDSPQKSLFLRKLVSVKRSSGAAERCWIYALNPDHTLHFASAS